MHFSSDAGEIVRTRQHVRQMAQRVRNLVWKLPLCMVSNERGAASVLPHFPAHPVKVRQSKEKTMTQLVPESWQ